MMIKSRVKCPKCKSKNLSIYEITEAYGVYNQDEGIIDLKSRSNDFGNIVRVDGYCEKCSYRWKIKNSTDINDLSQFIK